MIRTPDGKLAILDFGLMTQITDDQKFGMIEAISHLVHRDYEGIGDDFKRLDFIPQEARVMVTVVVLRCVVFGLARKVDPTVFVVGAVWYFGYD